MVERVRTIAEIEQDLAADRVASTQVHDALEAHRKELVRAQTAAIGWNPDYPSPHAASILAFSQTHGLDPHWLGEKVSQAMHEVIRDSHSHSDAVAELTAEGWYRAGISFLGRDHHKDGPFLSSARSAFSMAEQAARTEEEGNPNVNPEARDSLFYKFLVDNFAVALKEIVYYDFWDHY